MHTPNPLPPDVTVFLAELKFVFDGEKGVYRSPLFEEFEIATPATPPFASHDPLYRVYVDATRNGKTVFGYCLNSPEWEAGRIIHQLVYSFGLEGIDVVPILRLARLNALTE